MRITRIDIEGREGRFATIARRQGSRWIEITILTPYQPQGKGHLVAADAAARGRTEGSFHRRNYD